MRVIIALALATLLLTTAGGTSMAQDKSAGATPSVAVGAQYDTAHVYVTPADLERFSDSLIATFGGTKSQQAAVTVTPTPSKTMWQAVFTPGEFVDRSKVRAIYKEVRMEMMRETDKRSPCHCYQLRTVHPRTAG
jgi:hypothetical protein